VPPARSIRIETTRLLRAVAPDAAATGQEIDERVQALFTGGDVSPSPIGTALMAALTDVMEFSGRRHVDHEALVAGLVYGYCLRLYAERHAFDVPSFPLPPGFPLTSTDEFDSERWAATPEEARLALLNEVSEYGGRDEVFGWMTISVMNVVFAWAAAFVHYNRPMRGRVAKTMNIETIASSVRVGYSVRSFELGVGQGSEPLSESARQSFVEGRRERDVGKRGSKRH
jgi:hypothetical protein